MSRIVNGESTGRCVSRPTDMTSHAPSDRAVPHGRLVLPAGTWPCLIDYLVLRFKSLSRETILERMANGDIAYLTGEALSADEPYHAHRRLRYARQVAPEAAPPFTEDIVFQDEHLLVADKPPFMTVVPAGQHLHETLLVRLRQRTGIDTLVPMHRIDRETAGLVMFTIRPETRGRYQSLFESKAIAKTYEAIAAHRPSLLFPLRHASYIEEGPAFMQMQEVPGRTANAVTDIELMDVRGDMAKYRVRPETGKKHQIRIHFSALGMPILNDRIYPLLQAANTDVHDQPLQLLARSLSFLDPLTGQQRRFETTRQLLW